LGHHLRFSAILKFAELCDASNMGEKKAEMDQNLVRLLFTDTTLTLGDAIKNAKTKISDPDARRTYILFGDPLLRLRRLPGGARR
jgi:hypothetical protein